MPATVALHGTAMKLADRRGPGPKSRGDRAAQRVCTFCPTFRASHTKTMQRWLVAVAQDGSDTAGHGGVLFLPTLSAFHGLFVSDKITIRHQRPSIRSCLDKYRWQGRTKNDH
ncbi:hypothetical protein HRR83_001781 [Exophiala dermatitidis]|uniref:Uncharacterized protein n=1 Tax=Exophiala dermatitidis TaxID=5970 RepID=A0AAN6F2D2_EXODE|nr:hypothetical protein HRR73_004913 [Exophiala dermatitidis]KAJ4526584.1 hypothetical protein HRR74_001784 [Exophiala dermatitidis]KAJ4532168.1 hypothetical protein HRR76_007166 [Exophiala dermatitidis]KAJ4546203.1 hypothetical protein HRR77_004738 [Exophiala dermatitidis]KAJ4567551.1 hypothetical protein HRR79_005066 [Exophiala dermatitidis]